MQEVVLVIHLILALTIIVLVLIQRSSGGGLGIGGGSGGMGDFATARGAANVLTKATTLCAFMFFATSLTLAILAKGSSRGDGLLTDYDASAVSAPAVPGEEGADAATDADAAAPAAAPVDGDAAPETNTPEPPVSTE